MDAAHRAHLLGTLLGHRHRIAQQWHTTLRGVEPGLSAPTHESQLVAFVECFLTQVFAETLDGDAAQGLGAALGQLCTGPEGLLRSQDVLAQTLAEHLTGEELVLLYLRLTRLFGELAVGFHHKSRVAAMKEAFRYFLITSFELRSPINAIVGYARILLEGRDGPLTEAQLKDLTNLYQSGRRVHKLFEDLFDLAYLKHDVLKVEPERFAVADLVQRVAQTIERDDASRWPAFALHPKRTLEVVCAEELGEMTADPERVQQVILYLVRDLVVPRTAAGTIRLVVRRERQYDGEVIAFEVRSPDRRPLDMTPHGIVLEYEVLLGLVQLMGGILTAEGDDALGSVLTLYLPVGESSEESSLPSSTSGDES